MKRQSILFLSFLFLITACSISPRPIDYGKEECFYCKMAIVDSQHAAELVSSKGKVFVYDAIECMVAHYKETSSTDYSFEVVNDFETPGAWINGKEASYLISEQMPSPMGANLNAFSSLEKAQEMQQVKSGEILSWEELLQTLK